VLKAKILAAVEAARLAVGDLLFETVLVERGAAVHVPGSAPTYPETLTTVSVYEMAFDSKEIDGERVLASDRKWLVFPVSSGNVPKPNDIFRSGAKEYRVVDNDKTMAGDVVALSTCQVRVLK
jgi:hypothetical protein